MTNEPSPAHHAPLTLTMLAATALLLAAVQWIRELLAERRHAAPLDISRDFAARFAVPVPQAAPVRNSVKRPER